MSKYAPLIDHLKTTSTDVIELSFSRIEQILGFKLPPVARRNPTWWTNSRTDDSHTHAHEWLQAGWEKSQVNINEGWVTFRRAPPFDVDGKKASTAKRTANTTLIEDLDEIEQRNIGPTTKSVLSNARIGQGQFRTDVLSRWGNRCAVTGSTTREAIRASHILPWRECMDEERLDPNNGLPLIASLDALFDIGLISFDSSGRLLVSSKLTESERKIFGLGKQALLKKPSEKTATYLAGHRQKHGFGD